MSLYNIQFTIPKGLIFLTLTVCVLPITLTLFGVDFGLSNQYKISENYSQLSNIAQKTEIYKLASGKFVHIILVSVSICIALFSIVLSFFDYTFKKNAGTPIAALALLGALSFDLIHLLFTSRFISLTEQNGHIGSLTWFLSRTFHAALLLLGISIFLYRKNNAENRQADDRMQFLFFFSLNLLLIAIVSVFFLVNNELKPEMVFPTQFVSKPYDLIPLFLYTVLGVFIIPKFCDKYPNQFSQTLLLSIIPAIATQLHMALGSSREFDNHFMIAHFLRGFTYLIPLIGLMLNYIESFVNEKKVIKTLNTSIIAQKNSEDQLKSILNSSLNGVMAFTSVRDSKNDIVDFKIILANDESKKITYREGDELINKKLLEEFPIHKNNGLFNIYKKVVDTGIPHNFEFAFDIDNQLYWLQISAVKMEEDGFAVTFTNISERKKIESQIIRSENLYRSLAGNIPDSSVFIIDKNYVFQLIDGTLLGDLGINKDFYVNKYIYDALPKERADQLVKYYSKALKGEKIEFEDQIESRTFRNIFLPIKNSNGEVIFGMAVSTDITKKVKTEKALINIERLAITGKITRSIAHEIRNPLTNINLAADQLKSENTEEDRNLYIEMILRNSQRINKLISEILNSSKTTEVKEEKCLVTDILDEVVEIVRDRTLLKQIAVTKSYSTGLKTICVDIEKMKVAFINVLINATEAIDHLDGVIEVSAKSVNDRCEVKIKDNGLGISKESIASIFEPFYTDKPAGIGLGLITTQNIILSHQGDIDVESEIGKGTIFTITLNFCKE